MNSLIILAANDSEEVARTLIAAANINGIESSVVLSMSHKSWLAELPVDKVIFLENSNAEMGEKYIDTIQQYIISFQSDIIFFISNDIGNELSARLSYRMGGSSSSYVTSYNVINNHIVVHKRTFGFHMECALELKNKPCFIALEKKCTEPVENIGNPIVEKGCSKLSSAQFINHIFPLAREEKEGIDTYKRVLCVGRGVGSLESAKNIEKLGELLNFGVGSSRPPVLNCWMPINKLVGLSGTMIAPDLLITFGISGCAAFIKGVEKSKTIIAIDSDPAASIFKHCDVGIIGDCNEVAKYLLDTLVSNKN